MKRALSLILCAVTLLTALCGCTTLEKDETGEYDKGAIIPMYLGTEMYNFDPQVAYLNDSNVKILSLLFASLTDIDEDGKLQMTLIDSYEIIDGNRYDEYKMRITLKNTKWSDGRAVTASDVVYSWKRILDVDFDSEAACLLYDIKNARAVKAGDMTIDDLGLTAPETLVVEIEFERSIDYDQFLRNLSSPALVPLREDIVSKSTDWAKKPATMVTSGPFTVKAVTYGDVLRLERSNYYFLDSEKNEKLDKYVIPFRIETDYSENLTAQLKKFGKYYLFYLNELPLDQRKTYKEQYGDYVNVYDLMSTTALYLNNANPLFSDSRVREALSLVIDRDYIADNIVVFAKAATGFIPYGVTNGEAKTSWRETVGDLVASTPNLDEAKNLLKEAGVTSGEFTVNVNKLDDVHVAIADYIKGVWEELGFTVKIAQRSPSANIEDSTIYNDVFTAFYDVDRAKDLKWDVMLIDYQALSEDPFTVLAPFATEFSGNGIDLTGEGDEYTTVGHVTCYASEEYDQIIENAYAEVDPAKRAEILHDAEKLLMEDMPVIPLVFNQNAYITNSDYVDGFKVDYYGLSILNRVKMSDYMEWKKIFDTTVAAEQ